jgi:hypothetical protein
MQNFEIMRDPSELEGFCPVDAFNKMYPEQSSIKGYALASLSDDQNPEKVAVVLMRTFIENGNCAKEDQKYVVGIRFHFFGDMATIDVISLDKGYHKEICYDHLRRMGWPSWSEEMNRPVNHFDETTRAPFLFIGGHLQVKEKEVNFFGSSGDYGDKVLFSDGNSIAAYASSVSGIELGIGKKEIGGSFVKEILQIMYKHKLKSNFYEELVQDLFQRSSDENLTLTSQHVGSLITMKVSDRMISEGKDMLTLTVDEVCGGSLGRAIMLFGVARKMRASREND